MTPQGEVFFHDRASKRTRKFGLDGKLSDEPAIPFDQAFAFTADGRLVAIADFEAGCLAVAHNDNVYATDAEAGKVWLIKPDGAQRLLDEGLKGPTGVALSPDGLWLAVMERHSPRGYSYRVQPDGTVDAKQHFYWAHVPDWADDSGASGMYMDRDGRAYVATSMGVQVFDRNGRSRGILPMPAGEATSIAFGGAKFDTLFVVSGGRLYRRQMKAVGAPSFQPPIKLPPWGAG